MRHAPATCAPRSAPSIPTALTSDPVDPVELDLLSQVRQGPARAATSPLQPCDIHALTDQRNQLMQEASALSACRVPAGDVNEDGTLLMSLETRLAQVEEIDRCMLPLLHQLPADAETLSALHSSRQDLQRSVRLRKIAALEQELCTAGVRFEPGQLGRIHHDGSSGPFPTAQVIQLAWLHAADGQAGGALIASRLAVGCSRHIPSLDHDPSTPILRECTRLAREVFAHLSDAEQRDLLAEEPMPLLLREPRLDAILMDYRLTMEECLDRITASAPASLHLMARLLSQEEAWTPTEWALARHLHDASVANVSQDTAWKPWLDHQIGQRLSTGPVKATHPIRNLSAEAANTHDLDSAVACKTLASFALHTVFPHL